MVKAYIMPLSPVRFYFWRKNLFPLSLVFPFRLCLELVFVSELAYEIQKLTENFSI